MAELKPFEVIMRLSPYAAQNKNEICFHAEKVAGLVRCKDCKHKPTGSGVNHDIRFPDQDYRCPCRCEDFWYSWMPDDDWFCANGERKENEE